jgi:hypothetical protein
VYSKSNYTSALLMIEGVLCQPIFQAAEKT